MKFEKLISIPMMAVILLFATPARAVPSLQLDIFGGTYDASAGVETIMASGNSFSLYAYGLSADNGGKAINLSDTFFLSIALVPKPSGATGGNFGSFTINGGTPINVTADMTYGTPPLETFLGGIATTDPGDLQSHGIFETYFIERSFSFVSGTQSGVYNTETQYGLGPQSGAGMYYKRFDFNITGLDAGYGLHFDLYNETRVTACKNNPNCVVGDLDAGIKAPFSHDAQAMVTTPIPEPEIYAMLGLGLGLMGWVGRRRKQQGA